MGQPEAFMPVGDGLFRVTLELNLAADRAIAGLIRVGVGTGEAE